MKFFQIHTFYDAYLRDFAARHSNLGLMGHDAAIKLLLEDRYSACHLIAPHLPVDQFEARLCVANCEAVQRAWAQERGLEALSLMQILEAQIEEFKPDIIYASDPVNFDSRFFRAVSWQPKLLMGWRAAPVPEGTDWSTFDLMVSNHPPSLDIATKLGVCAIDRFEPGLPGGIARAVEHEPEACDVLFSGQWSPDHTRRNAILLQAARGSEDAVRPYTIEFHVLSREPDDLPEIIARHRHMPKFGMEMHRLFKRGRICLNATIDVGQGMSANMRLFEIAGSGGFQLMEHHDDIHRYFEPDREIVTYRGPDELVEKIRHYLEHPEERREIARRGQQRCERDYSMERRIPWFADLVTKHLEAASKRVKSPLPGAGDTLRWRMKFIRSEKRAAKTERRLRDREAELAALKSSFAWKLARPLLKVEGMWRGKGRKESLDAGKSED